MFGSQRNKIPSLEEVADVAKDSVIRMANHTAKSAREMGGQIEEWAEDLAKGGYESVRARPITWGAASLGIGALMGGLYALWQRDTSRKTRGRRKTVAARTRAKLSMRAMNGRGRKRRKARKAQMPAAAE